MEEKSKGKKPKVKKGKGRGRISEKQWSEIQVKYETGSERLADIAKKYDLSKQSIVNRANRKGWGKYGSLRETITKKLFKDAESKVEGEFAKAVKEANEAALKTLQDGTLIGKLLMAMLSENLSTMRKKYLEAKVKAKAEEKPLPDAPVPYKQGYLWVALMGGLRQNIIEGERVVMGITDSTSLQDSDTARHLEELLSRINEGGEIYGDEIPEGLFAE